MSEGYEVTSELPVQPAYRCWRLHIDRLAWIFVLEVRSRHDQLPPHGRWKATICEHAPNYGAQSPPGAFEHTGVLRRVGGGKLLDNTGLQVVQPKLLPGVLAALVGAPTNDAAAKGDGCIADGRLKRLKSLVLVGQ